MASFLVRNRNARDFARINVDSRPAYTEDIRQAIVEHFGMQRKYNKDFRLRLYDSYSGLELLDNTPVPPNAGIEYRREKIMRKPTTRTQQILSNNNNKNLSCQL